MIGYKTCPEWLKESYRKAVKYICEQCKRHEDTVGKLTPHRMIRGNQGGTYIPRNVKMVCNSCHKEIHGGEFT